MYSRFLNNNDYLGLLTSEALQQLTRGNDERLMQAEEAAESSLLEYLSGGYLVEEALAVGKDLLNYNRQITYPAGSHFYLNGKVYKATRTINGYKAPSTHSYWSVCYDSIGCDTIVPNYTQRGSYAPGDIVVFSNIYYRCEDYNGWDYDNIRVPGVDAWEEVEAMPWEANVEYGEWSVVSFQDHFYALTDATDVDRTVNPHESDNWGLIGSYDPLIDAYAFEPTEFVEYEGHLYRPLMNPNADEPKEHFNIVVDDPRNPNLKKHMLRLAVYELHKLISPNNVSQARITDYETSIMWLRDAMRFKINPQIARRLDDEKKPVTGFAIATFQKSYDPYKNPWHI